MGNFQVGMGNYHVAMGYFHVAMINFQVYMGSYQVAMVNCQVATGKCQVAMSNCLFAMWNFKNQSRVHDICDIIASVFSLHVVDFWFQQDPPTVSDKTKHSNNGVCCSSV